MRPETGRLDGRSAVRVTVAAFGVVAAIAGIEHGVGAALQGSVPPAGLVFESWPDAPAYEILAGEPAMTVVPDLLVSGVLTILVSLGVAAWSIKYLRRSRGRWGLVALSFVLLLVGGGFGPPIVGFLVGTAAARIDAGRRWLRRRVSEDPRTTMATLWPYSLVIGLAGWLSLWPGVPLLSYLFGIENEWLVLSLVLVAFATLLSTFLTGFAYDDVHGRR